MSAETFAVGRQMFGSECERPSPPAVKCVCVTLIAVVGWSVAVPRLSLQPPADCAPRASPSTSTARSPAHAKGPPPSLVRQRPRSHSHAANAASRVALVPIRIAQVLTSSRRTSRQRLYRHSQVFHTPRRTVRARLLGTNTAHTVSVYKEACHFKLWLYTFSAERALDDLSMNARWTILLRDAAALRTGRSVSSVLCTLILLSQGQSF
eukprot:6194427-Pleurochrysis_carterae.AAC.6